MTTPLADIFVPMLIANMDDLRSGKLPKGKFVGKYIAELNKIDKTNAISYKCPQVVDHMGKDANNNWVDYMLGLNEDEYCWFKYAVTNGN